MLQCGFSVILEALMGGIVFAKLSKPKKRTETLVFSREAVIAPRDGLLCLMCRIGDLRRSHIISAQVRMFLVRNRVTREVRVYSSKKKAKYKEIKKLFFKGEFIPNNTQELSLINLHCSERLVSLNLSIYLRISEIRAKINLSFNFETFFFCNIFCKIDRCWALCLSVCPTLIPSNI